MNTNLNRTNKEQYEKGLTDKFPFTTLLKNDIKNSWNNTWYPVPIDIYKSVFKIDTSIEKHEALLKNVCYNTQYLEFLEKEFAELNVSSAIYAMLVKTYVITSGAILEGLFYNLIVQKGWKLSEEYRKKYNISKKSKSGFAEQIAILEEQSEKNSTDTSIISSIKSLKNLRNRIHLESGKTMTDHDYNVFNETVKRETGKLMYEILTSSEISNDLECFDFLKVNIN